MIALTNSGFDFENQMPHIPYTPEVLNWHPFHVRFKDERDPNTGQHILEKAHDFLQETNYHQDDSHVGHCFYIEDIEAATKFQMFFSEYHLVMITGVGSITITSTGEVRVKQK